MKIVQINSVSGRGSTGKICESISKLLTENNIENYIFYGRWDTSYKLSKKYCWDYYAKLQGLIERITGNLGFESRLSTYRLIYKLKKVNPDIVHLHVLHSHECNLKILFDFLRKKRIKVFWTFHDCWAFTGYCSHFTISRCQQWKTECCICPSFKQYSFFFDKSNKLFKNKKKIIEDVDITIITPSRWLANLSLESMFKNNPIKVINNGINLDVFKPIKTDLRKRFNIEDKFILLGVAYNWGIRKGLDIFIKLSKVLNDEYKIILIGTNKFIDKRLPSNIISIHKTQNQKELAEYYSLADLFINPTREENFPTVNIESLACGTPVLTFNTGGSAEIIDITCGSYVETDNFIALKEEIVRIKSERPFSTQNCVKRSLMFNQVDKYKEYISLYNIDKA